MLVFVLFPAQYVLFLVLFLALYLLIFVLFPTRYVLFLHQFGVQSWLSLEQLPSNLPLSASVSVQDSYFVDLASLAFYFSHA